MGKMKDMICLSDEEKIANSLSHHIGVVDDCYRCIYCEVATYNSWMVMCWVSCT